MNTTLPLRGKPETVDLTVYVIAAMDNVGLYATGHGALEDSVRKALTDPRQPIVWMTKKEAEALFPPGGD